MTTNSKLVNGELIVVQPIRVGSVISFPGEQVGADCDISIGIAARDMQPDHIIDWDTTKNTDDVLLKTRLHDVFNR